MFAYNFPRNVLNEGVPIEDCRGPYCSYLPIPVFPTAFYETIMGLLIFTFLWLLRKRITEPGRLFFLYLIFNGMERFTIEQIRVNVPYHLMGMNITQAEIIALVLIVIGTAGFFIAHKIIPGTSKNVSA
jgi:prolipoprotein diacylglyceryltransferase